MAINCWEFMSCGREPGGSNAEDLGECPAAIESAADGLNGGSNGGRICWAISGTFCGGLVHGTFAERSNSCMSCNFFKLVRDKQGQAFLLMRPGQEYRVPKKAG